MIMVGRAAQSSRMMLALVRGAQAEHGSAMPHSRLHLLGQQATASRKIVVVGAERACQFLLQKVAPGSSRRAAGHS